MIVDMQKKNDDLKSKLELLENAGILGNLYIQGDLINMTVFFLEKLLVQCTILYNTYVCTLDKSLFARYQKHTARPCLTGHPVAA